MAPEKGWGDLPGTKPDKPSSMRPAERAYFDAACWRDIGILIAIASGLALIATVLVLCQACATGEYAATAGACTTVKEAIIRHHPEWRTAQDEADFEDVRRACANLLDLDGGVDQ